RQSRRVIDVDELRRVYRGAVADVAPLLTPAAVERIAKHNPPLAASDLREYMRRSEIRYVQALRLLDGRASAADAILEVGGFLGVFPLALARLGGDVTVAERYDLYGGALDGVRALLERSGVRVWDVDFTTAKVPADTFPVVLNMAMLEHVAGSPRTLMENLRACCGGHVLIEVPNLAYGYKRWQLLRGRTIHPPLRDVYRSATPFTGHHREYTLADVQELLTLARFRVDAVATFNYSLSGGLGRVRPHDLLSRLLFSWREVLMAVATPI
ncbi:MAG TPA: methyltransferase domain-containing protein, partial [Gaiellaceae bacterium]|nr:methyltransferase domain-containing protein [Gaiellaceae bacterium]